MKRIFLVLSIFCLFSNSIIAAPRSYSQARTIAMSFASKLGIDIPQINEARRAYSDVEEPYYIFNLGENKGFTIISGDDEMPDIVGYSTKGSLDMDNMPKGLEELLSQYESTLKAVRAEKDDALKSVAYRKNAISKTANAVEPLIQSTWGQGSPYNDLCPTMSDGTRCASGCVATAMAQVLNYYKYPSELLDDLPAYTTQSQSFNMPGISKGETYAWDEMRDSYNGNYAAVQGEAVAKLMLHCGYSVNMDYGYESGANMMFVPEAMQRYFGFDKELVTSVWRLTYTDEQWVELLNRELENQRPILFSAKTSLNTYSGHAFILDGVDNYGYYHVNWGWNGNSDGYFDLSLNGYEYFNMAIIGLVPDNGIEDEKLVEDKGFLLTEYNGEETAIHYQNTQRENESGTFSGWTKAFITYLGSNVGKAVFSVGIKDKEGNIIKISPYDPIGLEINSGDIWNITDSWIYAIPAGTDQIYIIISKDNGVTWDILDGYEKYPFNIITTETNLYPLPNHPGVVVPTNKEVDNLDILGIANVIQKNNTEGLDVVAADVNYNGVVNCCDIVAAVNAINGETSVNTMTEDKVKIDVTCDNDFSIDGGYLHFSLNNPDMEVTALQATIELPSYVEIVKGNYDNYSVIPNRNRLYDDEETLLFDDHIFSCQEYYYTKGTYTILFYSNSNTSFKDTSGELFKVLIKNKANAGYYDIVVKDLIAVSPTGEGSYNKDVEFFIHNNSAQFKLSYFVDDELYKEYLLGYEESITPEAEPTKEGYTFSGWSEIPETMPGHNVEVYGSFAVNSYKLTYKVDGEVYKEINLNYGTLVGTRYDPETYPSKEGYTFRDWSERPETMPAHDVEVNAIFTINSYYLSYFVNGEFYTEKFLEYGTKITPEAEPIQTGYTFSGWSEIPETMPAHHVEVNGSFEVNIYKVSYYVDESLVHEDEVAFGETFELWVYDPQDDDLTFNGWIGEKYDTMPAHDISYKADITSGISYIYGNSDNVEGIYTLDGKKVEKIHQGVYVIRMKDGTTRKFVGK